MEGNRIIILPTKDILRINHNPKKRHFKKMLNYISLESKFIIFSIDLTLLQKYDTMIFDGTNFN